LKFIDGIQFRTDNEPFKQEMAAFTRRVVDATREFFYTQNGPIILLQIENEYGNIQSDYGYAGQTYINWAVKMAQEITTEIPWFVCQQKLNVPMVINTCNGFYCHEWIQRSTSPYKQHPPMFTENWTGWFARWGDVWVSLFLKFFICFSQQGLLKIWLTRLLFGLLMEERTMHITCGMAVLILKDLLAALSKNKLVLVTLQAMIMTRL
jgi:hypothetical protein